MWGNHLVCRYSSLMFMPLCLDSVGSLDLVLSPSQLWSLNSRFFRSWPYWTASSKKELRKNKLKFEIIEGMFSKVHTIHGKTLPIEVHNDSR